MNIADLEDGVRILRLEEPDEINRWRPGFIGAYQAIFAGPPYFERFYPSDVSGLYRQLTSTPDNISLLAVRGATQVVGFGIAIPVRYKRAVARELSGLVPLYHTMYLAELGVLDKYRKRGLGQRLVLERARLIDLERYSHVVLRVPASRNAAYDMYRAMGFEDMGVYMEVASRRIDGRVTTDRRLFLHGVLSQLDLERA